MSYWTHVVACYSVDCNHDTINEIMSKAPKITGSEREADIFINQRSGHNWYISCDCEKCEYGNTVLHTDDGFTCDAQEGYKCPEGEYQTLHTITVCGDLRDRMKEQTQAEMKEFTKYIKKNMEIRNMSVKVFGW